MQGLGFMLHQMISTTRVTRSGLSLRSPFLIRKVLHAQVFFCHRMCYSQDRALEPASGFHKSVWAIRMSTCWQNQHTPVFSGTDCTLSEANPALNSNTPKGWEVQPPGSLAPWVNVQQMPTGPNGTGLSSMAPPTPPRCLPCPGREML